MESWPRPHRITVDEYYRMAEVGLLAPDARVELIEGEIIDMPPIGSRHAWAVIQLTKLMIRAVGDLAEVSVQQPVRLSGSSEPQPDVALLKPRGNAYRAAHPVPSDTLLVIEVSDATLRYDLERKMPLYASHGVPEAWVVDLLHQRVHFFRSPGTGNYADASTIRNPGVVPVPSMTGVTIDLTRIWSAS